LKFDKNYTKYWSDAIEKSIDGTTIAGAKEAKTYLDLISIDKNDLILDVGCSFGRMSELLSSYSGNVYGAEPDKFAVKKAKEKHYLDVKQSYAEDTGYSEKFFNLVFCWATFDVVDHKKGLIEFNRIIKDEGVLLISGKNNNYSDNDNLAFKAEKNAFLKNFPNKFTDLDFMLKNLHEFGFQLEELFLFPKRGDFGNLKFEKGNIIDVKKRAFYEYLLIAKKKKGINKDMISMNKLDQDFSNTSIRLAEKAGFKNAKDLFLSIGLD